MRNKRICGNICTGNCTTVFIILAVKYVAG